MANAWLEQTGPLSLKGLWAKLAPLQRQPSPSVRQWDLRNGNAASDSSVHGFVIHSRGARADFGSWFQGPTIDSESLKRLSVLTLHRKLARQSMKLPHKQIALLPRPRVLLSSHRYQVRKRSSSIENHRATTDASFSYRETEKLSANSHIQGNSLASFESRSKQTSKRMRVEQELARPLT